jgi:hypothetical protein
MIEGWRMLEGRGGDLHIAVGVVLGDDFVDVPF